MDVKRKKEKEENIIMAAEEIFGAVGFVNAKMDTIAAKAGITKVTLYSYFQSKENLYMAITHRGFQYLIEIFYSTIEKYKGDKGIESVLGIQDAFIAFCESNFLYSETFLNYFALIRSTSKGRNLDKLSPGIKDSVYFNKIRDIQNLPFKLTMQEIERGKKDGSIKSSTDSTLLTLQGWSMIVGYIKLITSSGESTTLLQVDLKQIKKLNENLSRRVMSTGL